VFATWLEPFGGNMRRRDFITLLGGAAVAGPFAARAQPAQQVRRIGGLMSFPADDPGGVAEIAALRQGLSDLGWVEGRNIALELRWPGADVDLAQAMAKQLVALKPDVLLARSSPTTAALQSESSTIPIVFVNVAQPLEQGFVQDLARPGGNITGFSNFESMIGGKWLQLLKEADPRIARVALVHNPQTAPFAGFFLRSVAAAAPAFAVEAALMPVAGDDEIERAIMAFARRPGAALIALPDSFTAQHRDAIIAAAARHRLPALYGNALSTPSGGLIAYAVDARDLMRRAAGYIDRILKGAKPAELPVQEPAKFELSINLKTAKALGLTLPQTLLAIADEVIE
jgi:putative tryptophan/tyrosine transport system substrate-binding protein